MKLRLYGTFWCIFELEWSIVFLKCSTLLPISSIANPTIFPQFSSYLDWVLVLGLLSYSWASHFCVASRQTTGLGDYLVWSLCFLDCLLYHYQSNTQTEPTASPSQDKDNKDCDAQTSRSLIYKMWQWINKLSPLTN